MMSTQPKPPHIRWIIRRDLPEVLSIERQAFRFPWQEKDFDYWLRSKNAIGIVAEDASERIVGYAMYELYPARLDLASLAVANSVRRTGVGKALVEKLKAKLQPDRRRSITTVVADWNLAAQLWLKTLGFVCNGIGEEEFEEGVYEYFQFRFAPFQGAGRWGTAETEGVFGKQKPRGR